MADERAAYSDSSRRSEKLSCTKYFHPSYGLFPMIFRSLNNVMEFPENWLSLRIVQFLSIT